MSLWVLGCVFLRFSSRTSCTCRTLSLPQSGSGASCRGSCREQGPVEEDLVTNKVLLKKYRSGFNNTEE